MTQRVFLALFASMLAVPVAAAINAWSPVTSQGMAGFSVPVAIHPSDPNIMYWGTDPIGPTPGSHINYYRIYKTTNGGASWTVALESTTGRFLQVVIDPANPATVYAVQESTTTGSIFKSTNGGTDWVPKNFGLVTAPSSLLVDPAHPGTLYAGSYKSTDGGDIWQIGQGINIAHNAIVVDPANGNLLAATDGGVRLSTDGGASWSAGFIACNPLCFAGVGPAMHAITIDGATGVAYAAGRIKGETYRSTDRGFTWVPAGGRLIGPNYARDTNPNVTGIAVGSGSPAPVMLSSPCGFYKSLDQGATFIDAHAGFWPPSYLPPSYSPDSPCVGGGGPVVSSAASGDFFAAGQTLANATSGPSHDLARYTLDAAMPPVCELTPSSTTVSPGNSATLTATCTPGPVTYLWSANTGFSSSTSSGQVNPNGMTHYTVQGVNAYGSSSVQTVTLFSAGPRPVNVSTRGSVLNGENVLIAGFIIGGSVPKTVVVRARGPSMAASGVSGVLANPTLRLMSGSISLQFNDNWPSAPNAADIQASGFAPADTRESAVMMTLEPGAYTAIVEGAGGTTGVGIVEVFEVDRPDAPLVNVSTRGLVQTGENVMIAGFVVQGDAPRQVVVRARGPSLAQSGIANALGNPVLNLYSGSTVLASNDDWGTAANAAQLQSIGFAPLDSREAAVLVMLNPGAYTAIVTGAGGTTGVGIVEVFAMP